MLILFILYMSLFYSNPLGRHVGIPYESVDAVTRLNCLHFGGFLPATFLAFHCRHLADFSVVCSLRVLTFSLVLNAFRQEV